MKARDVDAYIGAFPERVQGLLGKVRRAIRGAAPKATEVIRFPYDEPLPLALIARIVRHKVKEDAARARARKKK